MNAVYVVRNRNELPKTYEELIKIMPPRPIHDATAYARVVEIIDCLSGFDLNTDQEDYLNALSMFVEAYENQHQSIHDAQISPLETLKFLMQEHNMSASELGKLLGNRSLGNELLKQKRKLRLSNVKILAEYFKVQPDLFSE